MKTRLSHLLLPFVCGTLLLASCDTNDSGNHPPIVLGNANTIVTETDSSYLRDLVADLQPSTHPNAPKIEEDTVATQTKPQEQPAAAPAEQPKQEAPAPVAKQEDGLNIPFKDVTVLIPNIEVKSFRKQDPQHMNGVTYQLQDGNINGNHIKIVNGTVTKVSQRYETIIVIDNDLGELPLDALSTTTDWETLRGRSNNYTITGLTANKLEAPKVTPATLKSAIAKAARSQRMSKRKQQEWEHSVRTVRTANQRPLTTVLTSVSWRIDGKDAKGKPFQKLIRVDIP